MLPLHPMLALALPSFLLNPLISMALPAVAGTVAAVGYQWLKKSASWVDALPPQAHAFVIGAVAIILPQLGKLIPGFAATDLNGIDQATVQSAVMLGLSSLTHRFLSGPNK